MQLRVCLGRPLTADEVARVRPMDDYHTQNYFRTLAHSEKQIECQYEAIVDCETATPGLCFAQREENP